MHQHSVNMSFVVTSEGTSEIESPRVGWTNAEDADSSSSSDAADHLAAYSDDDSSSGSKHSGERVPRTKPAPRTKLAPKPHGSLGKVTVDELQEALGALANDTDYLKLVMRKVEERLAAAFDYHMGSVGESCACLSEAQCSHIATAEGKSFHELAESFSGMRPCGCFYDV